MTSSLFFNALSKEALLSKIEAELDLLVPGQTCPYSSLFKAARYSLLGGGKRLRPLLVLATAEALGLPPEEALRPACALELIHTYSLIHDDLPCMDNDDFRRGKPSLHKAFSESEAVLAGDFLLTLAFEIIATATNVSPSQRLELIRKVSCGAGGHGMIAGQIMDMESENKQIQINQLELIHQCKTGALISTAVQFGGILGNATGEQLKILTLFSKDFGLAFQIMDDILDVTSNLKNKAGQYSSDLKNNKSTYVSLLGLEKAREKANLLKESALGHLSSLSLNTTLLKNLTLSISEPQSSIKT